MTKYEALKETLKTRKIEREAGRFLKTFKDVNQEELKILGIDMIQFGQCYYSVKDGVVKRIHPFDVPAT